MVKSGRHRNAVGIALTGWRPSRGRIRGTGRLRTAVRGDRVKEREDTRPRRDPDSRAQPISVSSRSRLSPLDIELITTSPTTFLLRLLLIFFSFCSSCSSLRVAREGHPDFFFFCPSSLRVPFFFS